MFGIVMGFILAVQFRVTNNPENTSELISVSLAQELEQARLSRDELQIQVDELRKQMDDETTGPELAQLKEALDAVRQEAGLTEVQGSGVEVTLNDSNKILQPNDNPNPNLYVIHAEDVLRILNELKAAGAKAISLNGQRFISTTEVRCIGPTILVNKNQRLSPPFVISAVGDAETLSNALKMKGGVIDSLQLFWGIQVDVKKSDNITVPAYIGGLVFEYAQPKIQ